MNTIGICLAILVLGMIGIGYYLLNEFEEKMSRK